MAVAVMSSARTGMRAGYSIIPSSRAQGGASGRVRVLAVALFHRPGCPPPGVAPAILLITRWLDQGIKPLNDIANFRATPRFTAGWQAIPAGFNRVVSLNPITTVFLPQTTSALALTRLLVSSPQGLPRFPIAPGPSASRWAPVTIALNLPRAVPLGSSRRSWILKPVPVLILKRSLI